MSSRILSEGGVRYELSNKGSFQNARPKYILNHVLSYRDTYDKFSLPRDVRKTIDRDIRTVENYLKSAKNYEDTDEQRVAYFRVLREYYTSLGPDNAGMRPIVRYAMFLPAKKAALVLNDLKGIKKELATAENKPEFED